MRLVVDWKMTAVWRILWRTSKGFPQSFVKKHFNMFKIFILILLLNTLICYGQPEAVNRGQSSNSFSFLNTIDKDMARSEPLRTLLKEIGEDHLELLRLGLILFL